MKNKSSNQNQESSIQYPASKNYSILLVDDEEILRESLGLDLKRKGHDVTLAVNGEDAIRKLANNDFDLIITDLIMEDVDGIAVLKYARDKNCDVLVMILTGYGSLNTAIDALRLGAVDYMLKPFNKEEMFIRVANCLKRLEFQRKVKLYENLLSMCCKCNKIRDDAGKEHGSGKWMRLEEYLSNKAKIDVSHTYCNECINEVMEEAAAAQQ